MKRKFLYITCSFIFLTSCGVSYYKNYDDTDFRLLNSNNTESFEKINALSIDWLNGDITIKSVPNIDKIQITESSSSNIKDEFKLRVRYDKNNDLNINYCASNITLVGIGSKNLTIDIPKNISLNSLSINASSGNLINVSNVDFLNDVSIKSNTMDVQINDIKCNNINIETNSGKSSITDCNSSNISVLTNSGDSYLKLNDITNQVTLNSISGTSIIDLYENNTGYSVDFNSNSGKYKTEFNEESIYQYLSGILKINYTSKSGNLVMNKYNG